MSGMNLASSISTASTAISQTVSAPAQLSTAAANGTAAESSAPAFNTSSAAFIPKKKIVKTEDNFPTLGMETAAPKKKGPTAKKNDDAPKKSSDPCYGKPASFFFLNASYPMLPADDFSNPRIVSDEQQKFLFVHYPEYAPNMNELFDWLYATAIYNEEQAKYQKEQAEIDKAYNLKPTQGGRGAKRPTKKQQDDEEEEYTFGGKPIKKPKAPPAMPKVIPEDPEKKKQREQKAQEAAALKLQKEAAKASKKATSTTINETIVEVDETKAPVSLVFIGHVDAGKSTISGNIMYLSGAVDERTIAKYKQEAKEKNRESWWLAYVMDENEEEKAKGKTVEVGRANIETPSKRWTIFDAPGHKNYVPNMIMGASMADFGALIISAKKGEFEAGFDMEGQTREHIQLAKSLGIYKLVVVINKMDEPSVKWSKDRFSDIVTALKPFLAETGYDTEKDITFVPISGLNGTNIKEPIPAGVCNWY